jgi:ribosomal RNA-processing protein 8
MSLFAVSGWNAPSKVAASDVVNSRKRKRAAVAEEDAKVVTATINIEKLMRKLDTGGARPQRKEKKKGQVHETSDEVSNGGGVSTPSKKNPAPRKKPTKASPEKEGKEKKRKRSSEDAKRIAGKTDTSKTHGEVPVTKHETAKGLTALQATMKSSLEGARFRCETHICLVEGTDGLFRHINELLYKSTSEDATKLVQQDPSVIEDVRE